MSEKRQPDHSMTFDAKETMLVIGLGASGQASVDVLRARGATVYAVDEKPRAEIEDAIVRIESQGALYIDPDALDPLLVNITSAILSPGVPLNGSLVRRVQDANVPVFSEIELAYRLCKAPIVAITGTKGKSTTTSLIGHLFAHAGKQVYVGGNIGNPLIREVLKATPSDWVIAEVSSFQLEGIRSFRPRVSVLLNISADHLDRYHSMDEYTEAKFRIFANQNMHDVFVGNLDDPRIAELHWQHGEARLQARQLWFTLSGRHERATMYLHEGAIVFAPISGDPRPVEIMRRDEIPLAGDHNVQNVMAALLAALAVDLPPTALREAVMSFKPMPHRLQPVGEVDGVLYVDDSKATNPGSVVAALRSYPRPIVLICGGKSKRTDFSELGHAIDERAKAVVLIGEAAKEIGSAIKRAKKTQVGSLEEAVRMARLLASRGDVVLLSPACASFDMFKSAEDRGEQFAAAVESLRATAGA